MRKAAEALAGGADSDAVIQHFASAKRFVEECAVPQLRAEAAALLDEHEVYFKVDAKFSSVMVGDLLATSLTLGHAMNARRASKAFGAILGKALGSLSSLTVARVVND